MDNHRQETSVSADWSAGLLKHILEAVSGLAPDMDREEETREFSIIIQDAVSDVAAGDTVDFVRRALLAVRDSLKPEAEALADKYRAVIDVLHPVLAGKPGEEETIPGVALPKLSQARFYALMREVCFLPQGAKEGKHRKRASADMLVGEEKAAYHGNSKRVILLKTLKSIRYVYEEHIKRHSALRGIRHSRAHHSSIVEAWLPTIENLITRADGPRRHDEVAQFKVLQDTKAALGTLLDRLPNELTSDRWRRALHSGVTDLEGDLVVSTIFLTEQLDSLIHLRKKDLPAATSEETSKVVFVETPQETPQAVSEGASSEFFQAAPSVVPEGEAVSLIPQ